MATYTPAAILPVTSLTSTDAYATSTAATTGVLRTIHAQANAAAHSFTVSAPGTATADAAQTRIFDAYALTANVPSIFNGWWVVSAAALSWLGYKCDTATGSIVMLAISGYTYA